MTRELSGLLTADPGLPRAGEGTRGVVHVAVGVLLRPDGCLLLTTRPRGKVYEGYWDLPGGKIEAEESVDAALRRELLEEIGLNIGSVHSWRTLAVDYPHALVELNFCKVFDWSGDLQMREGQAYSWEALPVSVSPVLPGTVPVLAWLQQERC